MKNEKEIVYIICHNEKCPCYKNGKCSEMTELHLQNKIRCDERKW